VGNKTDDSTPIGEGDYKSARKFQKDQEAFAKHGPVKAKAREAADALSGPEGKELERARKKSAEGKH
jgi:hypothetical protein